MSWLALTTLTAGIQRDCNIWAGNQNREVFVRDTTAGAEAGHPEDPYGMPSVSDQAPFVFVMPNDWSKVTWMTLPTRDGVPQGLLHPTISRGSKISSPITMS